MEKIELNADGTLNVPLSTGQRIEITFTEKAGRTEYGHLQEVINEGKISYNIVLDSNPVARPQELLEILKNKPTISVYKV
ncbi:hypothetical protein MT068_001386 [Salmonella enterica]|nr:hypothetical protein [Salmonella enterica]